MMTTNFEFNTDGSFQCILSILGQFPAFLPHTRGLYLSLSPCVKLSIGAFYGTLSQIGRAWRPVTVTYHPRLLPRPPCPHWHSYIPPTPGSPNPKLGHRETIYYYNCPPLPTADLYLNLFCAAGGLRVGWGLGDLGPRFAAGVKNSLKIA